MRVYLALGSNVGNRKENIKRAEEALTAKISDIKAAPIYESKAVGYTDQRNFLNTAVSGETDLNPEELLDFVKMVEKDAGRISLFRWGPREIDIDIIFLGDRVFSNERLEIPHPRAGSRDFVLKPLCDLDPEFRHPTLGKTVKELLYEIPPKEISIIKLSR